MSPKKPIEFHGRRARKGVLLTSNCTRKRSLPPFFLTFKLRKTIESLLPAEHHRRLRLYFDTYGCFNCLHKDVIYGGNGFCRLCLYTISRRLKKVDKELRARSSDPPPDLEEAYLRPYNSARRLLADLVPKMGKRLAPGKSPTKVYMKWLIQRP